MGDLGSILGWEDHLKKGKATPPVFLPWTIPWGHRESDTTERLSLFFFFGGGPEVKNPPASAGDTGLVLSLERSQMPWGN